MTYFSDHYRHLSYPLAGGEESGFRSAQIAALHAINAHFFSKTSRALVVMPTGAGKSAVLVAAPLLLRATRVLVLTPSRLVREQLGENFTALADLRKLGAIASDVLSPDVGVVDKVVSSLADWNALRAFDVVVATVQSLTPRDETRHPPPADLFDLVLVDEAHHAPARTWAALLDTLSSARQVLFTATPFRRDEREIVGTMVFRYDLKRARDDGIFGEIRYEAVNAVRGEDIDITIARATEGRFLEDQAAELNHLVMVRADTLNRARDLHTIYEQNTDLRLEFVRGQHSLAHVRKVIQKLRTKAADGIVCVNMFGEGFNLPELKIAAIHSPHKSLAITLQFIGRFARRSTGVGTATFLAEPHTSSVDLGALYEEGSSWRELVANLGDTRVDEEMTARETIDSFELVTQVPDLSDLSLYRLRPYCHAKVFRLNDLDIRQLPGFSSDSELVYSSINEARGAAVYVTRARSYPKWSGDDRLFNVSYDLFIMYFNSTHKLLFVCATQRSHGLYGPLLEPLTAGAHLPLSSNAINRVLRDLRNLSAFSLGLRVRNPLGRIESYQQRTGSSVDRTVQTADARRYDRGHLFATALDGAAPVTIGVSSSSKVWSNDYLPLVKLLGLFDRFAEKIASSLPTVTATGLDIVSAGEELDAVPEGLFAGIWSHETYSSNPDVFYVDENGESLHLPLLDCELIVLESHQGHCVFSVATSKFAWHGRFSIGNHPLFMAATEDEPYLSIEMGRGNLVDMADYLSDFVPSFYRDDLSRIEGTSLFPSQGSQAPFSRDQIETVDWAGLGFDARSEKEDTVRGRSVFEWVMFRVGALGDPFAFCDDGSGEMADFISCNLDTEAPVIRFFHCKCSAEAPGARQGDFYEVLGQAMRTSPWFDIDRLERQLRHRLTTSVIGFRSGEEANLAWFRKSGLGAKVKYEVYVVQPGLEKSRVSAPLLEQFAAVESYLRQGGADRFVIVASHTAEEERPDAV